MYAFVLNDYGEACFNYSQTSGDDTRKIKAREMFERAKEYDRNFVMPSYNLHKSDGSAESSENIEQVIKLEPNWANAVLTLAEIYVEWAKIRQEEAADKRKQAEEKKNEAEENLERTTRLSPLGMTVEIEDDAGALMKDAQKLKEESAGLHEEAEQLNRQFKELSSEARTRLRTLLPHDWLWDHDSKDSELDRKELDDELIWERELDQVHVRALFTYVLDCCDVGQSRMIIREP